ncbi:hypothetical protein R3P38DRAFT_3190728 [Favolaschia claudopus]|uniref:Uncharacterized protein n=1 Tax=Favolaschia claudopus TaxID=2862362 RepID=A0AAW0BLY3_9AGAR
MTAPIAPTLPSPDTLILEAGTEDAEAVLFVHDRRVEYDPLPACDRSHSQAFRYIIYSPVSPRCRLRLSLVGEITDIRESLTTQGNVLSFKLGCPSRATANAQIYHHQVLASLWNVAAAEHSAGANIISNWVDTGGNDALYLNATCSPYAKFHNELYPNAIAILDITLHRYDHFVNPRGTQREYNTIVHQIEVLQSSFLEEQGYLLRSLSLSTVQEAVSILHADLERQSLSTR